MATNISPHLAHVPELTAPHVPLSNEVRGPAAHNTLRNRLVDGTDSPRAVETSVDRSAEINQLADRVWSTWSEGAPLWNGLIAPVNPSATRRATPADRDRLLTSLFKLEQEYAERGLAGAKNLGIKDLITRGAIEQSFVLAHAAKDTQYDRWGSLQSVFTPHDAVQGASISAPADVAGAVASYTAFPTFYDDWRRGLAAAHREGWVVSQRFVDELKTRIDGDLQQIDTDLDHSPYAALQTKPATFTDAQYTQSKQELDAAIKGPVRQALTDFSSYLDSYQGRTSLGVSDMPNGKGPEAFAAIARIQLGRAYQPSTLHRYAVELGKPAKQAALDLARAFVPAGTPDDQVLSVFAQLPQNRYGSVQELEADLKKLVAAYAKSWTEAYGLHPDEVKLPELVASTSTTQAAYNRGNNQVLYNANPATQNRYDLAEIVAHEMTHWAAAMVGNSELHPLTGAVSTSLTTEGLGVYGEQLAAQVGVDAAHPFGLYSAPQNADREIALSFRAARMRVDTGLHAEGWTFERACAELKAATGYPDELVEAEVKRYLAWPLQASAYLLGLMGVQRNVQRVQRALGSDFNLPELNHLLLQSSGATPGARDASVAEFLASRGTDAATTSTG